MQLVRKGLLLTTCWDRSPLTWSSGIRSCEILIVNYIAFSLKFSFFAGNLFCKWLFSVYSWNWSLHQVFSTSALLTLWAGQLFDLGAVLVHCSIFNSIPDLYPLDANSNTPAVTTKNVCRHCQMGNEIIPLLSHSPELKTNIFCFQGVLLFYDPMDKGSISWH